MTKKSTRKRKIAVKTVNEEKENESDAAVVAANEQAFNSGPMYKIMSHVQTSEALHKKYIKDLQQLYTKMDHKAFIVIFIKMIKSAMTCDESNEYASTSLQFCAKFVASYDGETTHPVVASTFEWLLETISNTPHIRFRLCQFINMILSALGPEAALDDLICDKILEYMAERLLDCSPNVRLQAIHAMQRLQVPDKPDDPVVRAYQFHLCSDPSPRVRLAVISCLGRNIITIPYILDRLYDIDEKVRRYTYIQMSSYPVRSYKVSQRLLLLERGLNDRSEGVRKAASKVMLTQWLDSYKKDIIQLISALKLDATEADIERFRKVTEQMLSDIFDREEPEILTTFLPFDGEFEFQRCIPFDKLTMESALYWQCLSDFFQKKSMDEFDSVLPELSTFCSYTEKFCTLQKTDMDKFENLDFQYKLLSLLEILYKYDLGDEAGRVNLRKLLEFFLKKVKLNEKNLEKVIRCTENAITDQNERMQFLIGIVSEICQLNAVENNLWQDRIANEALANCTDSILKMKLTGLKVKILEAEEQEMTLLQEKNFVQAQKFTDEKNALIEEYLNLLKPLLTQPLDVQKLKPEDIITGLQILFHMTVSKKVRSLGSQITKLYNDFVCRQMASTITTIRIWALKCGTAFSMHFETIAKEVFKILNSQFKKNSIERIWEISVKCIFEILDLYGIETFVEIANSASTTAGGNVTSRRGGRLLYNTLDNLDFDDDDEVGGREEVGFILLMSHFFDTVSSEVLLNEIVLGFMRLILHGHLNRSDIIEKLLLRYFNPATSAKTNQYLSIFMEEMIRLRKQSLLMPSLLPTVNAVLTAPYDSPLLEIRPETITRFFIDIMRRDPKSQSGGHLANLHTKIAHSFLTEMTNNVNNREQSKLLSKEILKLELNLASNPNLKHEMKEMTDKLLACELESKTLKNLSEFKDMLDGRLAARPLNAANESDEERDENTLTNDNQARTNVTASETSEVASNAITPIPLTTTEESETTLTEQLAEQATSAATAVPNAENVSAAPIENDADKDGTSNVSANPIENDADKDGTSNVLPTTAAQTSSAEKIIETNTDTETLNNSQSTSLTAATADATTSEADTAATPIPTTFGHLNRVGQRYLRRSLNTSITRSTSESSDAGTKKIRIELRIDSDKKTRSAPQKPSSSVKSKKTHEASSLPKVLNSSSSRSLRMLSRQQRNAESAQAPSQPTQGNMNSSDVAMSTSTDGNLTDELNTSEVIIASPQPLPNARHRRGNETTNSSTEAASVASKPAATSSASVINSPRQQRQLDTELTKTPQQESTKTPEAAVTGLQKQRLPRKALYASATSTTSLQNIGENNRKRTYSKTPYLNRSGEKAVSTSKNVATSRSASSSSSTTSPKRKQARRSLKLQTPNKQKRLTAKEIESLLVESSSSDTSNRSSSVVTSSPAKSSVSKNPVPLRKPQDQQRKSMPSTAATSSNVGLTTRNKSREQYSQLNIMTRRRISVLKTTATSSSSASSPGKQRNVTKSRIPVKKNQASVGAISDDTSRSSSRSPRRKGSEFLQPALQSRSRAGRPTSRIPRRLK